MRVVLGLIAASALLVGAASAETRGLSGFDAVNASGRVEVEIVVGADYSVELTGPRVENVLTRVEGGRLEIETRRNRGGGRGRDAHVRITMPSLRALDVAAGAVLTARDVNAGAFALGASSGAVVDVAGACESLALDISSGANVRAGNFRCTDVRAGASSGASATVFAAEAIAVDGSSGASVRWRGAADARRLDLSSGASARRAD